MYNPDLYLSRFSRFLDGDVRSGANELLGILFYLSKEDNHQGLVWELEERKEVLMPIGLHAVYERQPGPNKERALPTLSSHWSRSRLVSTDVLFSPGSN